MSKEPDAKDEGTARRRRRKASLRVPSDTVPRRPASEPAAVSVAYALDEDGAPEAAQDGDSIHDLPTLINQRALPDDPPSRPDTEETPVPEVVTERLPAVEESEPVAVDSKASSAADDDDDEVTRAAGGDAAAGALSDAEPGSAAADGEDVDVASGDDPAAGDERAEAEPAAEKPAAAIAQGPAGAASGDSGDSVDISIDEDDDGVPVEVVDLASARARAAERSGPAQAPATAAAKPAAPEPAAPKPAAAAPKPAVAERAADEPAEKPSALERAAVEPTEKPSAPEQPAAEPPAAAAAPAARPRFVRAKTMALSEADLEEVMEEVHGNAAVASAAAAAAEGDEDGSSADAAEPEALDAGESGEILADDMLEEISEVDEAEEVDAPTPADGAGADARSEPADTPPPTPPKPAPARPSPPPAPARAAAAEVGQEQPKPKAKARRQGKPWFEEVFDEDYLRTLPFLTPRATQAEANFVMESFGIEPGAQVLDVACGYGRHAMELAARGYHVVGLDNSLPLLLRGADEAQRRGLTINFVHGDMREMTFDSQFDGAYCLFSSFGFFDDETNKKVAQNVARALKPGARFVVEVLNRDYLVADLPSRVWWEGDGCVVLEEVEFNYFSSRIVSNRSVVFDDGRQLEQEISLRSFSLHELGKLLHAAGFRVVEISGSMATRGRFFGAHSRDIVVVAERRGGKKDSAE